MGEVALCMGLNLHWSSPIQVCNSATWGTFFAHDRPCVVNDYIQQEVGLFQRNTADLEE